MADDDTGARLDALEARDRYHEWAASELRATVAADYARTREALTALHAAVDAAQESTLLALDQLAGRAVREVADHEARAHPPQADA